MARVLPGTALYRLSALIYGVPKAPAGEECLRLRSPYRVAEDLKRQVAARGGAVRRRVAAAVCPDVAARVKLPLAVLSLLAGLVLLAARLPWGVVPAAYGVVALVFNAVARREFLERLLRGMDEAIRPDLQLLRSDRTRAEAVVERHGETGSLDFLEAPDAPEGLVLPQGERVLLSVGRVLRARSTEGGLSGVARGSLHVTTARIVFVSEGRASELELDRIVRVDTVHELQVVVTPSKRAAPAVYVTLGHAHTLAAVIRLAVPLS